MALDPDEVVALIEKCETYWGRVSLALAFYGEASSYGVDRHTGARQVGRETPYRAGFRPGGEGGPRLRAILLM